MPQNLSPTSIADTPLKKERPKTHKRRANDDRRRQFPLPPQFPLPHSSTHKDNMSSFRDEYESPLSFTHDTTHDDTIATTYTPIPYDHHQTLEDAVQVPSLFLYNTYSPSDSDDLWASMPPIEKEPRTYRKIWGYGVNDKEVFIWITVDGRWLCEEPDDDEEYWRIALKELPYSDAFNDAD